MGSAEHRVRYELHRGDHWRLSRYLLRTRPGAWLVHGGLILGTAWLAASIRGFDRGDGAFEPGRFLGVAALMAVLDYAVQRLKSALRAGRTPGFIGPHELRITPEGLHGETDGEESSLPWAAVRRVVEVDSWLYLFLDRTSAVIVPLAAFPDGAAREAFVGAARTWLERASAPADAG